MRLISTRNPRQRVSFLEAVQACVPADGGLYIPEPLPCFRDVPRLLEMDFLSRSVEILQRLLGDELSRDELEFVIQEAFNFPVPLQRLQNRIFSLELFHGPTFAFQDFGCRFLASVLAVLADREGMKLRTVLTATTGNTGAAAAGAFWKRKGIRAIVLHPRDGIPEVQEKQCAVLGANVLSYAVEGSYDDCQDLVRQCLDDQALAASLNLTSANSLNIARIVAQTVTFFEAVAQVQNQSLRDMPVIAVPCGNFGNLYAGLLAQRMGLPVKAFIIATNENATVPRYLESGTFSPRTTVSTLSQGLDAARPTGWERVQALFNGNLYAMRAAFRWGTCLDTETRKSMWELSASGYLPDPHSAVAYAVLQERLGLSEVGILLATAHPAKSATLLKTRMNVEVEQPPALAELAGKTGHSKTIPASYEALKAELLG